MKLMQPQRGKTVAAPQVFQSQDELWYKDAVIYQVHVKSYFDSNNDGIGDFPGLISKLDYIAELGANCIWLLPFYPSPRLDDGYDIADYRGVHPDYGTIADVKRLVSEAHARGIRVVTELVLNHTSDQHPWFQRARQARRGSVYRDFYVWSDTDKKYPETRVIFIDSEKSNWTWDDTAKAFYWHRFYWHQPDLNFDNPRVIDECLSVLRYWLGLGIDGLRLDAVPYLVEREGTNNENLPETHAVLKRIRSELDQNYPSRMLLAEANQWPEDTKDYFGDGDECHMAFHFPLMPRMYMAIAQEDRFPISDILRQTPPIPGNCQWGTFLRNHDELTLEMVTETERDFLWQTYAADKRARLNLGIRRRLAPLMERDPSRIELMNYLLFSIIGTPIIYYGDEIGMGDNIHLGDRNGVRTPMQWSPDRNGGFSRVPDPSRLVLPVVVDPLYAYQVVNVESQAADPHSLLMWMRRVVAIRKQYPAFGRGTLRLLYPANRKILAYVREHEGVTILCVANLSRTPQAVELDLAEFSGAVPIELLGRTSFPQITRVPYILTLPPHGFYWFSLSKIEDILAPAVPALRPELYTLVVRAGMLEGIRHNLAILERDILPSYLERRRWWGLKGVPLRSLKVTNLAPTDAETVFLMEFEAETDQGRTRWQLPIAFLADNAQMSALQVDFTLSRVRRGSKLGFLTDAFVMPEVTVWTARSFLTGRTITTETGTITFEPTSKAAETELAEEPEIRWISAEQSNSSVIVDDKIVVKLLRRLTDGIHPEAEMGRYLTENGFANTPALLGEAWRSDVSGGRYTVGIAQAFVRNQGDAWGWTLELLSRRLSELPAADPQQTTGMEEYTGFADVLGRRVAEMHMVLGQPTDDPAFSPVQASRADIDALSARIVAQYDAMLAAITRFDGDLAPIREELQTMREAVERRLQQLALRMEGAALTRIHGDLHLGQVLICSGDVSLLDFEGEPAKPLDVRRAKDFPLRDVAGMLRSFDYAAAVMRQRSEESHAHISEQDVEKLVQTFRAEAPSAFLAGYRNTLEEAGVPPLASDQEMLDLFLIEKAAYEVVYEANNRPAWISVPLRAVRDGAHRLLGLEAVR